jgi:hypothetical protein
VNPQGQAAQVAVSSSPHLLSPWPPTCRLVRWPGATRCPTMGRFGDVPQPTKQPNIENSSFDILGQPKTLEFKSPKTHHVSPEDLQTHSNKFEKIIINSRMFARFVSPSSSQNQPYSTCFPCEAPIHWFASPANRANFPD